VADLLINLPANIELCLGESVADTYKDQLPAICIVDLSKAAKIAVRLLD